MAEIAQLVAAGTPCTSVTWTPERRQHPWKGARFTATFRGHLRCTSRSSISSRIVKELARAQRVWAPLVICSSKSLNAEILDLSETRVTPRTRPPRRWPAREHGDRDPPVVVAVHALGDPRISRESRFRDCQRDGGNVDRSRTRSVARAQGLAAADRLGSRRTCRTTIATASRSTGKAGDPQLDRLHAEPPKSSRRMSRRRSTARRHFGPCIGRWPTPQDIQPTPRTLATSSRARGSPRHGSAAPSPPTSSAPRWPPASRSLSGPTEP